MDEPRVLVDFGGGIGRPSLLGVAAYGVTCAYSVEADRHKVDKASDYITGVQRALDRRLLGQLKGTCTKIVVVHQHVEAWEPDVGAAQPTHAYTFWVGMPRNTARPGIMERLIRWRSVRRACVVGDGRDDSIGKFLLFYGLSDKFTVVNTFPVYSRGKGCQYKAFILQRV